MSVLAWLRGGAVAVLLSGASIASARSLDSCVDDVTSTFKVPFIVLETILTAEGGQTGRDTRHANGAVDVGRAQISTQHLPRLGKLGVSHRRLRDDSCLNLAVAAWHLRRDFDRTNPAWSITARWADAMLSYHSQTPKHRARYARSLGNALRRSNTHGQ